MQVGWGRTAALLYLATLAVALLLLARAWPRLRAAVAGQAAQVLTGLLAALLLMLAVAYPQLDSGGRRGGSDGDEALELGATALVRADYPYRQRTYLDNPISPMAGGIALAIPLALNRAVPLLGWLWLAALALWVGKRAGWLASIETVGTLMLLCPAALYSLASGSDYLTNSIAVMLLLLAVVQWPITRRGRWIAALLLGVVLATRANFWLLLPLLIAAIVQRDGIAQAVRLGTVTVTAIAAPVLPFYLADPAHFSPLTTSNKLAFLVPGQPLVPLLVVGTTALLALLLGLRDNRGSQRLLLHGALVLLLPVLAGMILLSVQLGGWDLRYGSYALFALPWGLLALLPLDAPVTPP